MSDKLAEMDRAIWALGLELSEQVHRDLVGRWQSVKSELVTLRAELRAERL